MIILEFIMLVIGLLNFLHIGAIGFEIVDPFDWVEYFKNVAKTTPKTVGDILKPTATAICAIILLPSLTFIFGLFGIIFVFTIAVEKTMGVVKKICDIPLKRC